MNVHRGPVGLFDSGLGGLSVAREIRNALPAVDLLYVADSRFCPYGGRSQAEIMTRSLIVIEALVERGARLVVIACNTATAVALEAARSTFAVPIIGLEPAVKPAVALSVTGRIGVVATPRTARSERLSRLIERFAAGSEVHVVAAPRWVPLVEAGITCGPVAREAVAEVVTPLVGRGIDTLVLGCTHYPFLRETIQQVAGEGVRVVDSGEAIARRTAAVLAELGGSASPAGGVLRVLTTGDVEQVRTVVGRLAGEEVRVAHLLTEREGAYVPASPKLSEVWTVSTSGRL